MPYVFEGGAFEDLLFKGRLKQAAVAAFEGFLAVAEQILDHVEFLPQPAPVQQLLLRPFEEIGEHDHLLVDQHLDQVLDDTDQAEVRPGPIVVGVGRGDVIVDEGRQRRIVGRHLLGALHRFGIDGENLAFGALCTNGMGTVPRMVAA